MTAHVKLRELDSRPGGMPHYHRWALSFMIVGEVGPGSSTGTVLDLRDRPPGEES